MNVIPHPRSVRRRVIVSEYLQFASLANGDLSDERHEVIGNAAGVFADESALVSSHGIEITQAGDAPRGVRLRDVVQDLFNVELGATIRVDRAGRVLFVVGQ